ncbi:MAG: hypothetical protein J6R80_03705 [Kiritimatiellae bacterium]|nr:hypothetical protein [Kiritimatiellia bacterium]
MMSVTKVLAFIFVNASIVLSAFSAEFSNEFVELKFSPEGQLSSIREKSSGRELIGDKCSFMDITLEDGRVFPASSMYQNEKGLRQRQAEKVEARHKRKREKEEIEILNKRDRISLFVYRCSKKEKDERESHRRHTNTGNEGRQKVF